MKEGKKATDDAVGLDTMYLKELHISNFRSCRDLVVPLQAGLTLLVGENNAGKSNVIDALRLCTLPLNGRRSRYFETEDRTRDADGPITLTATYNDLSKYQAAQYIGAYNLSDNTATFTTRFFLPEGRKDPRGRVEVLSGLPASQDSEHEKRDQINHVYLAPLRDAQRELDSASAERLNLIMNFLVTDEQRDEFIEQATSNFESLSSHEAVTTTSVSIQAHLTGLTEGVRHQRVGISFLPPDLRRLARSLRLKMSEAEVDLADISSSGLGYANLLFLATVILELQKAKLSELTLFLLEEPEAHLHPQLQAVLLDYLQEQAKASVQDDSGGLAGRIQVIATTHSPNLASAVGTKSVVVLRSSAPKPDGPRETVAVALAELKLDNVDRRKIDQYLDATRSELLFTRRVILVEGIAEAVLLPVLARYCVLQSDARKTERRSFRGSSIVIVGSVDFKPYIRLLLSTSNGVRLTDRLIVITDADPELPGNDSDTDNLEDLVTYNRASELRELAEELGAGSCLHVAEAPHTLEADLLVHGSSNHKVLEKAFVAQHPRSSERWSEITGSADAAQALYEALRKNKKLISKGQFAHDIAEQVRYEGAAFICPTYLREAIELIVKAD